MFAAGGGWQGHYIRHELCRAPAPGGIGILIPPCLRLAHISHSGNLTFWRIFHLRRQLPAAAGTGGTGPEKWGKM